MYESYFGLKEAPFNMTPDPRFLYYSKHHKEALSAMLYGVENRRGFLQLTGEIGAGKTTLCRTLLRKLGDSVHSSLIFNPRLSEFELLQSIVEDFGIKVEGSKKKHYFDALNRFLLTETEKGYNAVLIIDEAQLLTPRAVEQIRLLTNLETATQKLLQIILVGQPELKDLLKRPDLKQARQRITIRYHLPELAKEDIGNYLKHRLRVAGCEVDIFTEDATDLLYKLTTGIPRIINVLADRAMLAAYARGTKIIDSSMIECAQEDLEGVHA
ncbi:MAG: AAA family ATPase [Candidatus Omnitrophica bacterium]|nr:AAA family ATPase [Candidatus Omnitrophota bacterium]